MGVMVFSKWLFVRMGLFMLVMCLQAANYLNIKSLLDLTCLTVANMIKGIATVLMCSLSCGCDISRQTHLLNVAMLLRQDARRDQKDIQYSGMCCHTFLPEVLLVPVQTLQRYCMF